MPFKTPRFWAKDTIVSRLLSPLSCLYLAGHKIKTAMAAPYRSSIPVLCVGGVVAGGSGKTPAVHALLEIIVKEKIFERPVIITRGYGGTLTGPTLVDIEHHSARDTGDEALLHATYVPTIISKDRAAGARLAEAMGADIILLDDGMQNTSLEKTLSVLVIDAAQGTGNGRLLPAGPLREPLPEALSKCGAVISINGPCPFPADKICFNAHIAVTSGHDKRISYLAFAGLGRPEKFKDTLLANGFTIAGFESFADHHPYTDGDMNRLLAQAGPHRLITTEKDFVKIPEAYRDRVDVLSVSLLFEAPSTVRSFLDRELKQQ